ncbi:hypothetical protein BMWSH_2475 [Priestia megaterium WSH-002]|uniref:Uncharacterized protein n=1 Tax=Priestia megaterium (strain WSH-002) TaxID=1006007 RepID=A0A8D3X1I3_PRIMW|nr:hypothetical protein BMWSH_2475 [Priestia megaterium WSH-002]
MKRLKEGTKCYEYNIFSFISIFILFLVLIFVIKQGNVPY